MGLVFNAVVFTAPTVQEAASVIDTGPQRGVGCDPAPIGLLTLEALRTRRSFNEILEAANLEPIAMVNEGQRLVLHVRPELASAVANLSEWQMRRTAAKWAKTEGLRGYVHPREALAIVQALRSLFRETTTGFYLWTSVADVAFQRPTA